MFSIWEDHYLYCDKQKVLEEIEQFSLIRPHPPPVGVIHDLVVHYRAHDSQKTKKQLGICYQILGSHQEARYGGYLKSGGDLIAFPHLFKTTSRWLKTLLTVIVDKIYLLRADYCHMINIFYLMAGALMWRSHICDMLSWISDSQFCDGGVNNLCSGPSSRDDFDAGLIMKHFTLRWQ